jgi:hypothetical protein
MCVRSVIISMFSNHDYFQESTEDIIILNVLISIYLKHTEKFIGSLTTSFKFIIIVNYNLMLYAPCIILQYI